MVDKFTFYTGWKWLFKPLTNEEKGELITATIDFFETGKRAVFTSESVQIAFGYIAAQIERDKAKAKTISRLRRKAGLISASLRKSNNT